MSAQVRQTTAKKPVFLLYQYETDQEASSERWFIWQNVSFCSFAVAIVNSFWPLISTAENGNDNFWWLFECGCVSTPVYYFVGYNVLGWSCIGSHPHTHWFFYPLHVLFCKHKSNSQQPAAMLRTYFSNQDGNTVYFYKAIYFCQWPLGGGKTEKAGSRSREESGLISRACRAPVSPLALLGSSWKSHRLFGARVWNMVLWVWAHGSPKSPFSKKFKKNISRVWVRKALRAYGGVQSPVENGLGKEVFARCCKKDNAYAGLFIYLFIYFLPHSFEIWRTQNSVGMWLGHTNTFCWLRCVLHTDTERGCSDLKCCSFWSLCYVLMWGYVQKNYCL